ncbi:OmpA family protein [Thiopseudomonas denitrificans]|uniref:OOP family OmpA-OmpF porin n=1 Tax=Thiopseudomonas denitrificans TaxID=1501432 RepID=A0A4R6UAX5_9GAMM|nr:OmpA family protein [Thiopseudomonas denitrificans]TDQ40224.1 OOP family OmpA-OmpF porin [Thiopseudomonas denitrificans]
MKLKNTLGIAVAAVLAAGSVNAFAQGQGAVEVEATAKRYFTDSARKMDNGNLYGGSVSYFLTEAVSLGLSYGEYHSLDSKDKLASEGNKRKKINGSLASLDATYHFRSAENALRPYLSAGIGHQSLSNIEGAYSRSGNGRDRTTMALIGAGAKYYFADNFFVRAGVDGMHGFDNHQSEWMAGLGIGLNFGGAAKPAPVVVEEPAPVVYEEPVEPETVRVELEVLFDFDKANVKDGSYADIQNLAEFMKQYPQLSTTVEGHTDSVGPDAYNQKLSERRANAVRQVLVEQYGVESERVNSVGYGESRPIADNSTKEGRALNRRVEAAVEAQVQ